MGIGGQNNMKISVCIVTCPRCGKMHDSNELHVCSDLVTPSILMSEVESLRRRVAELERLLKKSDLHYHAPETTAYGCTG